MHFRQINHQNQQVSIVLVHGACHDSWCWKWVARDLRLRGWQVDTVDLPFTSLQEDAAVVRAVVTAKKKKRIPVLLVGHSYGGVVISEGGHEADRLVYCAALLPEPGQSASDIEVSPSIAFIHTRRISQDGNTLRFDPTMAATSLYGHSAPEIAFEAGSHLRAMPIATLQQPVGAYAAWHAVRASYVVCLDDRAISPIYQISAASKLSDKLSLDSDHSPFLSTPYELAEHLDELAIELASQPNSLSLP